MLLSLVGTMVGIGYSTRRTDVSRLANGVPLSDSE